jgi:hypothetical protein
VLVSTKDWVISACCGIPAMLEKPASGCGIPGHIKITMNILRQVQRHIHPQKNTLANHIYIYNSAANAATFKTYTSSYVRQRSYDK